MLSKDSNGQKDHQQAQWSQRHLWKLVFTLYLQSHSLPPSLLTSLPLNSWVVFNQQCFIICASLLYSLGSRWTIWYGWILLELFDQWFFTESTKLLSYSFFFFSSTSLFSVFFSFLSFITKIFELFSSFLSIFVTH